MAVFEAKYTKSLDKLESECDAALQQIDDRMYAKEYEDDYDQILCYGISFFKKRCMVKKKLANENNNIVIAQNKYSGILNVQIYGENEE